MTATRAALLATILALPLAGAARDDRLKIPIGEATSTLAARAKLDPKVKFFFGESKVPEGAKTLREVVVNRKTNAFGKSDLDACQWVFLSVLLELQDQARKAGGDAVVGIVSYYKKEVTSSEKDFVCGAGSIMAGVALRGSIAKLAAPPGGEATGIRVEPGPTGPPPAEWEETRKNP